MSKPEPAPAPASEPSGPARIVPLEYHDRKMAELSDALATANADKLELLRKWTESEAALAEAWREIANQRELICKVYEELQSQWDKLNPSLGSVRWCCDRLRPYASAPPRSEGE